MNINYEYYKVFYYVACLQNVTKAAEALATTQPNVTRAIKKLESELKTTLFYRTPRGMVLSQDGEKLYDKILPAIGLIEDAENELLSNQSIGNQTLSIYTTSISLNCFLIKILKKFLQRNPQIKIKLRVSDTPKCFEALSIGMGDFGFVTTPFDMQPLFVAKEMESFDDVAVCSKAFEIKDVDKKKTFKELSEYPMITLNNKSSTYQLYSNLNLSGEAEKGNNSQMVVGDYTEAITLASEGFGILFMPSDMLENHPNLMQLSVDFELPSRTVYMIKQVRHPYNSVARMFERFVMSEVKNT